MNQGARNKLRNMGGIMASSPKLMQAAFQAGGSVRPPGSPNAPSPLAVIPSLPSMQQPSFGPRTSGYAPGLLPTGTVDPRLMGLVRRSPTSPAQGAANATLEEALLAQRMEGPLTFGGGAQPLPTAPDMPFERRDPRGLEAGLPRRMDERVMRNILAGEGSMSDAAFSLPEEDPVEALLSASEEFSRSVGVPPGSRRDRRSTPTPSDVEPSRGSRGRDRLDLPERETPEPSREEPAAEARRLREEASKLTGRGSSNAKRRLEAEAAELEAEAAGAAADSRQEYFEQGGPRGLEALATPIQTSVQDPEKAEKMQQALQKALEDQAPPPDGGDGGGDDGDGGPPPAPSKKDLRSRYKEKIALFKEIYGEDDEDRARDKAMSLAMLGLAIASGQSPDFLTNVTQGTMAGLQGMSEQERARRERDRGLQTLALETAIGEQSAEAEAAARAAEAEYDRETRFEVERIKAQGGSGSTYTPERLRQLVTNNITSNPGEYPALLTEDGSLDPSRLNRFVQDVVKGVGATRPLKTTGFDAAEQATVDAAKERLAQNPANRSKIAQRLSDVGIDPGVLGDG